MSDKFILNGIEIFGRHGCSPEEQKLGQNFIVDVEMDLDLSIAGKSDNIEDTVDYPKVLSVVEKIVGGTPKKLIETVAEEIAETILKNFEKVESVKVTLHKPFAPLPFKYSDAVVQIVRGRNFFEKLFEEK